MDAYKNIKRHRFYITITGCFIIFYRFAILQIFLSVYSELLVVCIVWWLFWLITDMYQLKTLLSHNWYVNN